MVYALGLPDALRRRGLKVEVVPGWETRSAGSFNPKGAVGHWTAGPRGSTTRPSLNVVINGRPDLDGPLCNVYGARDGTAVVVAAGRANHAGAGSWRGLVGNSSVFGTEMEGADAADFTAAQRWAYPRIHAAYCDLGRFGPDMNCGHSEWAGPRKQDINGYTPGTLRSDIAAVLAGAPTSSPIVEDDMPLTDADIEAVADRSVKKLLDWLLPSVHPDENGKMVPVSDLIRTASAQATMGHQAAADAPGAVWGYGITSIIPADAGAKPEAWRHLAHAAGQADAGLKVVSGLQAAIVAAVSQLPGVSADTVAVAAQRGVDEFFRDHPLQVTGTVSPAPGA